jgi:hypothetical protein
LIEGKEAGINPGIVKGKVNSYRTLYFGASLVPHSLYHVISLDLDALDLFVAGNLNVASLIPLTSYTLSLSLHHVHIISFTHLLISFSLGPTYIVAISHRIAFYI